MLKLQWFVLFTLLGVSTLEAQNTKESSFIIMSSHGLNDARDYNGSFYISGTDHVNTFLYKPHKMLAYGFDFNISNKRDFVFSETKSEESSISGGLDLALAPSIYLFAIDNNKHQAYLGVSVGVAYAMFNDGFHYSVYQNNTLRGYIGANIGYNYKFNERWMVGARLYYSTEFSNINVENLYYSSMKLISVGFTF